MSNETLLYICGIVLAVSAVGVSFLGLKVKGFPGKAMPIVVLWFAIFVGGSATFAVLHAKDEEDHKAHEAKLEEANEHAEEDAEEVGEEGTEGVGGDEEENEAEAEENAEGVEEEAGPEEGEEGEEGTEGGAESGEEASGGDPEAGAEVFASTCSACHGEDGHGGAGGPDLTTMPKAQNEPEAIEQVTNGGGGMPAFGEQLSEEEIQDVAAFVVQKVVGNG